MRRFRSSAEERTLSKRYVRAMEEERKNPSPMQILPPNHREPVGYVTLFDGRFDSYVSASKDSLENRLALLTVLGIEKIKLLECYEMESSDG